LRRIGWDTPTGHRKSVQSGQCTIRSIHGGFRHNGTTAGRLDLVVVGGVGGIVGSAGGLTPTSSPDDVVIVGGVIVAPGL